MRGQAMSEAPAVLTPRLDFDKEKEEEFEIPAFLRKDKAGSEKQIVLQDPITPITVQDPIEQAEPVISEAPVLMDEPAEVTTEIVKSETVDPGSDAGSSQNLDDMSVEDLQRQQQEIDRKIAEKREAEKKNVISQIVDVVNTYKIPVEELVEALGGIKVKRKGVKAKTKYRDPATGATWSGRGKEPAWIKGKNRAPFEIK